MNQFHRRVLIKEDWSTVHRHWRPFYFIIRKMKASSVMMMTVRIWDADFRVSSQEQQLLFQRIDPREAKCLEDEDHARNP